MEDPHRIKWEERYSEETVVAYAHEKIALLPGEELPPKETNFWLHFAFSDISKADYRHYEASIAVKEHFSKNADPKNKATFEDAQKKLIAKLDADLAGITKPAEAALDRIRKKYDLRGNSVSFRIQNYIKNTPEKFAEGAPFHNPIFNGIFNFEKTTLDLIRAHELVSRSELGLAVAQTTNRLYGWNIVSGQAKAFIAKWLSQEQLQEVLERERGYRDAKKQKNPISATELNPLDLKHVHDAKVEFLRSTGPTGSATSSAQGSPYKDTTYDNGSHGFGSRTFGNDSRKAPSKPKPRPRTR